MADAAHGTPSRAVGVPLRCAAGSGVRADVSELVLRTGRGRGWLELCQRLIID